MKKFTISPYEVVQVQAEGQNSSEEKQIEEILDIDGELKGVTPFSCEVIPRCLRVIL